MVTFMVTPRLDLVLLMTGTNDIGSEPSECLQRCYVATPKKSQKDRRVTHHYSSGIWPFMKPFYLCLRLLQSLIQQLHFCKLSTDMAWLNRHFGWWNHHVAEWSAILIRLNQVQSSFSIFPTKHGCPPDLSSTTAARKGVEPSAILEDIIKLHEICKNHGVRSSVAPLDHWTLGWTSRATGQPMGPNWSSETLRIWEYIRICIWTYMFMPMSMYMCICICTLCTCIYTYNHILYPTRKCRIELKKLWGGWDWPRPQILVSGNSLEWSS